MKKLLFLFALSLCSIVAWAQFSAVAPTGQTLYYSITSSSVPRTVKVVYPGWYPIGPWTDYTKPTGSLTIPSTVSYNGNDYSVTRIEEFAFEGCYGLTSVTIPDSVTSIGRGAFRDCRGLTSVVFNATSCDSMSGRIYGTFHPIFEGCTNLASLTIGENVTKIPDFAFEGCSSLTSVTIGNSVTTIGNSAFGGCGLTSVTIPNSVTSIGYGAFAACSNLTSVTIPNSVTSIESSTFYGCSSLTSVTIPNSVTTIGDMAFEECRGLMSITIESGVLSIQSRAFAGCDHVNDITCNAVVPPIVSDHNAFEEVWKGLPLTVPNESVSQYQSAYAWREFTNIIGDGPTQGIEEADSRCEIFAGNGDLVLHGAEGKLLRICDIQGRTIVSGKAVDGKAYTMPSAGVYLIQVGNHPAQKVMVK